MCLSIPVKLIKIDGTQAIGDLGGTEVKVNLDLIDDPSIGDYVLVHTGMAIQKISDEEAQENIRLYNQLLSDE